MRIKIWDKIFSKKLLQLKMFSCKFMTTKKFIPYVLAFIFILKTI